MPEILDSTKNHKSTEPSKVMIDKPQDLQFTLDELKSKSFKTKKDKESIGILEAVIKNGY